MNEQERENLKEIIAQSINHGLNDLEIYSQISYDHLIHPYDLIGVIRDLMTKKEAL